MDILKPPQNYISFRCHMHGVEPEHFFAVRKKFYDKNGGEDQIKSFCNWLYEARHHGTLPKERIEIREPDGKKHGHVVEMMIYDIEYFNRDGQVFMRKLYVPLKRGSMYASEPAMWGPSYSFYKPPRRSLQKQITEKPEGSQ